ncbi:MAG: DNRLRE domain-containing protein [Planctomycetia bacterium]|nr:DNRLRE domain-containing protein [Planctomycetia bacterium]
MPSAGAVAAALPAPVAIALADSTWNNGIPQGATVPLANIALPTRQRLRWVLGVLRRASWKVWAVGAVAGLVLACYLGWHVWDWWATSIYRITPRDGAGATSFYGQYSEREQVQGKSEVPHVGGQGGTARGFIRFDVSALRGQRNIRDAVLQFTVANPRLQSCTLEIYGMHDKHGWERWDENQTAWNWGQHFTNPDWSTKLGTIQVGRTLAQTGGTITLSGPALVDFLRKDTNDIVTFGFLSPEDMKEPIEIASKHHTKLTPPTLRITLR